MRSKQSAIVFILMPVIGIALLLSLPDRVYAAEKNETPQFSLNMSLEDNLRMFAGKRVNVSTVSGAFSGKVKAVKNGILHLEKLSDKSYYDALIRTKEIVAFDAQVRGQ